LVVLAALAHVPAALVFLTATALVFGAVPRRSIPLGWGMLAAGLVLGEFGELFGLPVWLQDLSPFRHSSAMPVEPFDPAGALGSAVTAVALAALAGYSLRRRELTA
jgi:ABC-2 type transport system permease protein